jgi:hypothetical protein
MWNIQNKVTDGRTQMNILQKWMKIATRMRECGDRCCNWSPQNSSNVKRKKDTGGTSPAVTKQEKKMNSHG